MAHISGGDWEYALEEVRDVPNVYIDLDEFVCDRGIVEKSVGVRLMVNLDNPDVEIWMLTQREHHCIEEGIGSSTILQH